MNSTPANLNELKEDGRAGLFYAIDQSGNYVASDQAPAGCKYTCPVCGCAMHLTTTKSGKKIFARDRGRMHTNPICITLERNRKHHTFKGLEPEDFITSLCRVNSKKASIERPIRTDSGSNESAAVSQDDKEMTIASFSSLKQIAESGINKLNPDAKQGEHKISEYIITYKYAYQFFSDPSFELGARIVYARFSWTNSNDRALIFSMFMNDKERSSVKFRLLFTKLSDFKNYRDKFGTFVENETGKTVFKKKYAAQDVLIACDDWYYIDKYSCPDNCNYNAEYCKSCLGMYQAVFTNSKQIYLLPPDQ
ncbi:MAG: hypothetical protein K6E63_06470 [Lachnospiraceae bacterium]|nr:hypothetical protein [Lachnospiraceae bacterium]